MMLVSGCGRDGVLMVVKEGMAEIVLDMECRGLAYLDGQWFACSGAKSRNTIGVHKLDSDFNVIHSYDFAGCDWHGLVAHDGLLYAVDMITGTMHVLTSDLDQVCTISASHENVNDVWLDGPDTWASAFNRGILYNGELIADGVQPHSVQSHDGDLWWCESARKRVWRNDDVVAEVDVGYPRGLLVQPDGFWYGLSRGRRTEDDQYASVQHSSGDRIELPCTEIYGIYEYDDSILHGAA